MTRKYAEDFEREESRFARRFADLIRREAVSAARVLAWTLRSPANHAGDTDEHDTEVMQGVGVAALPEEAVNVEAIAVNVEGHPDHSVIVAARDVSTLKSVIERVGLTAGETLLYTRDVCVKLANAGIAYLGRIGVDFSPIALGHHTHALPPMQAGPYPVMAVSPNPPPGSPPTTPWPPASPGDTGPSNANSEHTRVN